MANFGAPEKVLSEHLTKSLIRWKLGNNPNNCFLFRQRKPPAEVDRIWKSFWICIVCEKVRRENSIAGPACNFHLRNDGENETILTNPENGHHPNCVPNVVSGIEAQQLKREASSEVQKGRKRPLQAYSEAAEEITKRFRGNDQIAVEENFPTYEHVKRTLYRRAEKAQVQIDNPRFLPIEYRRTTRGRYAEQGNPFWDERWLLYPQNNQNPNGPLILIFASDLDLRYLGECHTWIMDGTFKACPKAPQVDGQDDEQRVKQDFTQIYTIHGFGRFENEAVPCVSALLSAKTADQYRILLTELRNALYQRLGNHGALQRILVNNEIICHNAIEAIFPNIEIKTCFFHFTQNLVGHMHSQTLKQKYLIKIAGQDEHLVKSWFGCVKALALLPVALVPFAWELLQFDMRQELLPTLISQEDMARLENFATYFTTTWINGNQFHLNRWNHFLNYSPRTTNHAEGYHLALNRNGIPKMHMALHNFLHALQQEHNRIQQRIRKLYAGTEAPKRRDPLYQRLHEEINNEKLLFRNGTGYLWENSFNQQALFNNDRNAFDRLVDTIRYYLRVQRHKVGDKQSVN